LEKEFGRPIRIDADAAVLADLANRKKVRGDDSLHRLTSCDEVINLAPA
jgi:hypothetical protein